MKLDFTRATTCQKCLRTGDIENVGRTAYHHTFFEMLGNFSFGDYFKPRSDQLGLGVSDRQEVARHRPEPADRHGLPRRRRSGQASGRSDIKLPARPHQADGRGRQLLAGGAPSQGPDGVCGPCSEIYLPSRPARSEVEIWNLVFTQFNRVGNPPNNLRPLPSKNIDTGMGLERTAAVLQGVDDELSTSTSSSRSSRPRPKSAA